MQTQVYEFFIDFREGLKGVFEEQEKPIRVQSHHEKIYIDETVTIFVGGLFQYGSIGMLKACGDVGYEAAVCNFQNVDSGFYFLYAVYFTTGSSIKNGRKIQEISFGTIVELIVRPIGRRLVGLR